MTGNGGQGHGQGGDRDVAPDYGNDVVRGRICRQGYRSAIGSGVVPGFVFGIEAVRFGKAESQTVQVFFVTRQNAGNVIVIAPGTQSRNAIYDVFRTEVKIVYAGVIILHIVDGDRNDGLVDCQRDSDVFRGIFEIVFNAVVDGEYGVYRMVACGINMQTVLVVRYAVGVQRPTAGNGIITLIFYGSFYGFPDKIGTETVQGFAVGEGYRCRLVKAYRIIARGHVIVQGNGAGIVIYAFDLSGVVTYGSHRGNRNGVILPGYQRVRSSVT